MRKIHRCPKCPVAAMLSMLWETLQLAALYTIYLHTYVMVSRDAEPECKQIIKVQIARRQIFVYHFNKYSNFAFLCLTYLLSLVLFTK